METALYYTLSTIAQTLAGALAILVAVVLFRLSALKQTIDESREVFAMRNIDVSLGWPILLAQGLEPFLTHLETTQSVGKVGPSTEIARAAVSAHRAYRDWGRINQRLYVTLSATVTDMGLCFIALPFTPRIACSQSATWAVLGTAIGLGITCLGLYVWLIAAMVRRTAD